MARANTRIGDVFSVKVGENSVKYFQLVSFDLTQLNSDVIRAFRKVYPIGENSDLSEVINGEVEFYAHCVTKLGLKMNLWEKVGNSSNVGEISDILFRGSSDSGSKVGEENVKMSNRWYVWRINDKDFTHVGKLEGENRNAEVGICKLP